MSNIIEDVSLHETVKLYAENAVRHAKSNGVVLDYSNTSIEKLEEILDTLHRAISESEPSDGQYAEMANTYGSYAGETLIRNLGYGTWIIPKEGPTAGALVVSVDNEQVLFPAKVYRRLKNGREDNVAALYMNVFNKYSSNKIALKIF